MKQEAISDEIKQKEQAIEEKPTPNKRVVSNMVWKILERFGAQGVTFIVSIILARILDPVIYGTVALLTVITSILQVFVEGGFSNALVQKKDSDDVDFSTVFYFNIVMCVLMYALFFFIAPLIARFYQLDDLTVLIRVLGVVILISGVKSVQLAYVSKHLLFKKFFFATLAGTITAAFVGIFMAYKGYGVWALVVQNIVNQTIDTIILWIIVKWRPKLKFSFERFKRLFKYGWKFLVSSLIDKTYTEIRSLIIGKRYSVEDLSFYNRGEQFPKVLGEGINYGLTGVMFPVMSEAQYDKERLKALTKKTVKLGGFITLPCMIGLAACSSSLISVLLTDKWLPAAPFMMLFCFSYCFFPISTANLCAINALGKSHVFLILEIIKKVLGFAVIFVTMWFGPLVIAIGVACSSFVAALINAIPNKKNIDYGLKEQMIDYLPSLALALVMAVGVYFMKYLPLPVWLILIIQIFSGAAIYILGAYIFKFWSLKYIRELVKSFFAKKRKI